MTRWVLYAVAAVGIASTARSVIAPARGALVRVIGAEPRDPGAEAMAVDFARAYLTFDAGNPERHQSALARWVGTGLDPEAGMRPAAGVSQRVVSAEIVQAREPGRGEHLYTVVTELRPTGSVALSLNIKRTPAGRLRLARYPAIVEAPVPTRPADLAGEGLPELTDPRLTAVVDRALTNYLARSAANLAADVMPGARVGRSGVRLTLERVVQERVEPDGAVLAVLVAHDEHGNAYTLSYVVAVAPVGGRWEIAAIETDPTS